MPKKRTPKKKAKKATNKTARKTAKRISAKAQEADAFLEKLDACGWFSSLPGMARGDLRKRVLASLEQGAPAWHGLANPWIDGECIEGPESYRQLLQEFSEGAFGRLKMTRVTAKLTEDGAAAISFRHGGKTHEAEMPLVSDYVDDRFLPFVNGALEAAGEECRFVELDCGDQTIPNVFTTPEAVREAVSAELVPQAVGLGRNMDDVPPKEERVDWYDGIHLDDYEDPGIVSVEAVGDDLLMVRPMNGIGVYDLAARKLLWLAQLDRAFPVMGGSALVCGEGDGVASLRETRTGKVLDRFEARMGPLGMDHRFHDTTPDGKRIVTIGGKSTVEVRDLPGMDIVSAIEAKGAVDAVAMSPSGELVAICGTEDRSIRVHTLAGDEAFSFTAAPYEEEPLLPGDPPEKTEFALTPLGFLCGGRYLMAEVVFNALLWRTDTWAPVQLEVELTASDCARLDDDRFLCWEAWEEDVMLFDARHEPNVVPLSLGDISASIVAASRDGKYVAVKAEAVLVYDIGRSAVVAQIPPDDYTAVGFTWDSKRLVVAHRLEGIHVFDLAGKELHVF